METKEEKVKKLVDFAKEVNKLNAEIRKLGIEGLEVKDLEIPLEEASVEETQESQAPQSLENIAAEINAINARARELGLHGIVDIDLGSKQEKSGQAEELHVEETTMEEPVSPVTEETEVDSHSSVLEELGFDYSSVTGKTEKVEDTVQDELYRQEVFKNIKNLYEHNYEMIQALWKMIESNQQILEILAKSESTQSIASQYYPFAASKINDIELPEYSRYDSDSEKAALAIGLMEQLDVTIKGAEVVNIIMEEASKYADEIIKLLQREEEMRREDFENEMRNRLSDMLFR